MNESGKMNIDSQKHSFDAFVKLFKYGTIGIAILLILMALFLV